MRRLMVASLLLGLVSRVSTCRVAASAVTPVRPSSLAPGAGAGAAGRIWQKLHEWSEIGSSSVYPAVFSWAIGQAFHWGESAETRRADPSRPTSDNKRGRRQVPARAPPLRGV